MAKENTVKESKISKQINAIAAKAQADVEKFQKKMKGYADQISAISAQGFQSGYKDAETMPNVFGGKMVATISYNKGMSAKRREVKAKKDMEKTQKQLAKSKPKK